MRLRQAKKIVNSGRWYQKDRGRRRSHCGTIEPCIGQEDRPLKTMWNALIRIYGGKDMIRTFALLILIQIPLSAQAGVIYHESTSTVEKQSAGPLVASTSGVARGRFEKQGVVVWGDVPKKRILDFYGPSWCPACPVALADINKSVGNEFNIRVYKDDSQYPSWVVTQAQSVGYPLVHWTNNSGSHKIVGWSGIEAFRNEDGVTKNPAVSVAGDESAPTPGQEVERVIGLLPKPEIGFVDYGCGDARWCIAAAERWGCRVTGVEINPARAAAARERVRLLGLSHLITIITGDATTTDVEADVGVVYLYADVLEKLVPKLENLTAFASYMHRPPGLPVVQNGDSWIYTRAANQSVNQPQPAAVWGGQYYSQPVCNSPGCAMCNAIRRQLNFR